MASPRACAALGAALALLSTGCGGSAPGPGDGAGAGPGTADRPNLLLVVWDTARRDRVGLYGAERDTTPGLDALAATGLVFDDCRAVAPSTVPSHGSMFTGLFPAEHGATHATRWLPDANVTLAELLADAGYGTYLFSANPNISSLENFDQGFGTEDNLWGPRWRDRAREHLTRRLLGPEGLAVGGEAGRAARLARGEVADHELKGCGALVTEGFLGWLDGGAGGDGPWFACLNYMEAHYPLQPPLELRERFLAGPDLEASFTLDRSERRLWRHVFGLEPLPTDEVRVLDAVYDAAMAELDALFVELWRGLEARGALEDTLVVLVSDHGEHLGEHGLFDHRYSLRDELVRLPLVLWWPGRVAPGRTDRPVTNQDLFLTFLEAADVAPPAVVADRATDAAAAAWAGASLLDPGALPTDRARFAHYLDDFGLLTEVVGPGEGPPDADRFRRPLRAVVRGERKLVVEDPPGAGAAAYDLAADPGEATPLAAPTDLAEELEAWTRGLAPAPQRQAPALDPRAAAEQEARLRALGYGGDD